MIPKAEALAIVIDAAPEPRETEEVPLEQACGRVLARPACSDMDMPPFEKSSMDGWAVRAQDVRPGVRLRIIDRIMAGQVPARPIGPGETMKVMTGAPVPEGADAVVMVERSEEEAGGEHVTILASIAPDTNICHRGEDLRRGEEVLPAGAFITPESAALLAMIGVDPVPVWRVPSVAVIPTGDELVEPGGQPPGPGEIRESNGLLLDALLQRVSPALKPLRPGIARDDEASLDRMLDVGLDHDVLLLSGGVSMGDLDLVGAVLSRRGLEVLVEKVAIKPGKPLLFGRVVRDDGGLCHVFGLPGNPLSTWITFELFVRPFLLASMGAGEITRDEISVRFGGGGRL